MFLCWSLAQIGDQVIRINGLPVEEALHKEMLNMIRSKTQVTLKVRSKSCVSFVSLMLKITGAVSSISAGGLQPFYE